MKLAMFGLCCLVYALVVVCAEGACVYEKCRHLMPRPLPETSHDEQICINEALPKLEQCMGEFLADGNFCGCKAYEINYYATRLREPETMQMGYCSRNLRCKSPEVLRCKAYVDAAFRRDESINEALQCVKKQEAEMRGCLPAIKLGSIGNVVGYLEAMAAGCNITLYYGKCYRTLKRSLDPNALGSVCVAYKNQRTLLRCTTHIVNHMTECSIATRHTVVDAGDFNLSLLQYQCEMSKKVREKMAACPQ